MPWANDAEVKAGLVAALKRTGSPTLPPDLDLYVAWGVRRARGEILRPLNDRGYSDAQVDAWRDLAEFSFDQALFFAEVYMREVLKDGMGELMGLKDRRAELPSVSLPDDPDNPTEEGGVSSGLTAARREFDDCRARERAACNPWADPCAAYRR